MKKVIITFALIAVSLLSTKSFAQTANLNITISDVLSFSVTQPASLDVNFDTKTKYTNGTTKHHIILAKTDGIFLKLIIIIKNVLINKLLLV